MAESEIQHARRMSADQTVSKSEIPLKERFFRYFQHEITGKFSSDHLWLRWSMEGDVYLPLWNSPTTRNGPPGGHLSRRW